MMRRALEASGSNLALESGLACVVAHTRDGELANE